MEFKNANDAYEYLHNEIISKGVDFDNTKAYGDKVDKYLKGKKISSNENRPLYRGQCCGKWNLETTLERYTDNEYTIVDYLELIQSAKCAYESHFGKGYGTEEIDIEKIKYDIWSPHPHYSLLPYFRHLGFLHHY